MKMNLFQIIILLYLYYQAEFKSVQDESNHIQQQDYEIPYQNFAFIDRKYQNKKGNKRYISKYFNYIPKANGGKDNENTNLKSNLNDIKSDLNTESLKELLKTDEKRPSKKQIFNDDEVFVTSQTKNMKNKFPKKYYSKVTDNASIEGDFKYSNEINCGKSKSNKYIKTQIDNSSKNEIITSNKASIPDISEDSKPTNRKAEFHVSTHKAERERTHNLLESDTDNKRNFQFSNEQIDENLSLQQEINNIFSPNFKSFIFNPNVSTQAKFQICKTSKNESGTCRYIQHCFLPSFFSTIDQFMNNVCIIEGSFIGVCCPEFPVSIVPIKLQNGFENTEDDDQPAKTPKECGIGTNNRIVGGMDAHIKAYPWMVALLNNNKKFYCGGALINDRYVLTAAHCTTGNRNNEIIARVGEYDLSEDQGVHEDYFVETIKRHGQYNRLTLKNDIALLKLHKPVQLNEFVKTVCLPSSNKTYVGNTATLTGWGHVQGGISAFTSDVLQEASFPVISNTECSNLHGISISSPLICTAAPLKDKGACNGDSGGPLMLIEDESWKMVGIVSWGRRGCSTKYPSVFTRVSYYRDWIKEHAT